MTAIEVAGSNWDVPVLRALAERPSRSAVETVVDVLGDELVAWLRSAPYLGFWRGPGDPVAAMVGWLGDYYRRMHEVLRDGPAAVPGWAGLVRAAAGPARTTRLVVTMQLGYPLLLPLLLEEATGRPAYPVVHDQNPLVLDLYERRLRGRALVLGAFGAGDLRACLDGDGILMANLDTAYPGTRHVREVPFLGHRLTVPTGLVALAVRRSAEVRAMALVGAGDGAAFLAGAPIAGDTATTARAYAATFERWVSARPEQWSAWAGLAPC